MPRRRDRRFLPALALLLAAAGWNGSGSPSPAASRISIVPAPGAVRIVVDAGTPPAVVTAAYGPGSPPVLIVNLGPVDPPDRPAVPPEEVGLIRDVRIEGGVAARSVLFVTLAEALPFTLTTDGSRSVVELTKILRAASDAVPPEIQREIDRAGRKPQILADIGVADRGPAVEIKAVLGPGALTHVFALDQPLRLVVDFYDTTYARPTRTVPVNRAGLALVRIGQFRNVPDVPVTRLVFELAAAGPYQVTAGPQDWSIAFGAPAAAPAAPAAADAAPPADKPAEAKVPAAKPPAAADAAQAEKGKTLATQDPQIKYSGELISPKFKDADLRDVVLWLGEKYGLNVFFDPDVRGTVTCALENIPWDQFLDTILKINKMGKSLEGNVLRIMPQKVLAEEERSLQELRDTREQAGPLLTKTYALSYAKAADVLALMKNRKSGRGEILIDERTNTILATDVAEKIDLLDKLIAALDTPTPQVQIETRIIEATSTFVRNLGIQWGWKGLVDPFYGNQTSLQFPNKVSMDGAMIPQGTVTRGIGGPLGGYAVNLPAPAFNTAVGMSFANVLDSFRLDLALSAMESEGTGRIVSTQRATTLNNKEAYINQGRQIPVQTQANFTVTTQFFNAGLELRATPQITADGNIIMAIDIQNNAADFSNLVNGIPPITTQSAKTTVLVPDGGTTVIGGIYRSEDTIQQERVPFLHQIPILGALFKSLARTRSNRELLIFITPRIVF